ncbi:helix-turn-helix domain-containing protein [Methylopila capsulata]|uniref:HTH araC/xylS-type domain-containing protein n=1 Tax=Methylopila capsulata TaxID=61654 RepID=A0A9W6IWD1_9HYPH|nr:hypothetical protein GCM10008170_28610 [Methylopila capsulata]
MTTLERPSARGPGESRPDPINGSTAAERLLRAGGLSPARERLATAALADGDASVADVAALCGLSRSYFIRAFHATTGQTPHRWARERRLRRARDLVADTSEPIAAIAASCGFADQSHFTRAFRARWGESPANYRRRSAEQRPAASCGGRRRCA